MIPKEVINKAVKRLVKTYHPQKIYLFGSYAWGNPTDDSDLDLLVVVDSTDKNEYERAIAGHHALWGLEIPKDILIYTRNEFDQESKNVTTLCYKVNKEGVTVYAKS